MLKLINRAKKEHLRQINTNFFSSKVKIQSKKKKKKKCNIKLFFRKLSKKEKKENEG